MHINATDGFKPGRGGETASVLFPVEPEFILGEGSP